MKASDYFRAAHFVMFLGLAAFRFAFPATWLSIFFLGFAATWLCLAVIDQSVAKLVSGIGITSNAIVVFANGGQMPVLFGERYGYEAHSIWTTMQHARLWWMCDVLPGRSSIGDWLIAAGVLVWIAAKIWEWINNRYILTTPEIDQAH